MYRLNTDFSKMIQTLLYPTVYIQQFALSKVSIIPNTALGDLITMHLHFSLLLSSPVYYFNIIGQGIDIGVWMYLTTTLEN